MAQLSRQGDQNEMGGAIMLGASSVFCNGIPVGLPGQISDHGPYGKRTGQHRVSTTISASETVICEGSPVLKVGSGTSCGHNIVQGSPNVNVP